MIQALLPGALTAMLLATPTVPASVTSSAQFYNSGSVQNQKFIWVVKPEETLLTIAKDYYGDEKYWTTLWNDNEFITDPNIIEADQVLTLRLKAPKEQEEIHQSLQEKYPYIALTTLTPAEQEAESAGYAAPAPVVQETPPAPQPVTTTHTGGLLNEAQITFLGNCEAGMNPTRNSGNGYYGAFQFSIGTWNSMNTGYERADLAPLDVQKDAVQRLLSRSSIFTQFPGCARKMQAAGLL